jgi:hypothetical protein
MLKKLEQGTMQMCTHFSQQNNAIAERLGSLQKFADTLCKTVQDTNNKVNETKAAVEENKAAVEKLEVTMVNEIKNQAGNIALQKIYNEHPLLRILLAVIVNIGLDTLGNSTPFFNVMCDPNNDELYLIIHHGLLAMLKTLEPLFGTYKLPKNFKQVIERNMTLMGPEAHIEEEMYLQARQLFPCQPFKNIASDKQSVSFFKFSNLKALLKIAKQDDNSPFPHRSFDNNSAKVDKVSLRIKLESKVKLGKGKKSKGVPTFTTRVMHKLSDDHKDKPVSQLRPMLPVDNVTYYLQYEEKSGFIDFKCKNIGLQAPQEYFTPAVVKFVNEMRELHGLSPINTTCHVGIGYIGVEGEMEDIITMMKTREGLIDDEDENTDMDDDNDDVDIVTSPLEIRIPTGGKALWCRKYAAAQKKSNKSENDSDSGSGSDSESDDEMEPLPPNPILPLAHEKPILERRFSKRQRL